MAQVEVKAIKAHRHTVASGKHIEAGKVYAVPAEISDKDARVLIRMGKAESVEPKTKEADKADGGKK